MRRWTILRPPGPHLPRLGPPVGLEKRPGPSSQARTPDSSDNAHVEHHPRIDRGLPSDGVIYDTAACLTV